jgi:hypothetical protein
LLIQSLLLLLQGFNLALQGNLIENFSSAIYNQKGYIEPVPPLYQKSPHYPFFCEFGPEELQAGSFVAVAEEIETQRPPR